MHTLQNSTTDLENYLQFDWRKAVAPEELRKRPQLH